MGKSWVKQAVLVALAYALITVFTEVKAVASLALVANPSLSLNQQAFLLLSTETWESAPVPRGGGWILRLVKPGLF